MDGFSTKQDKDVMDTLKLAKAKLKKQNINTLNPRKINIINEQHKVADNQTAILG